MSKNLTRKGLAFGALVALGSSVLAGAPAYAADTVVLAGNYSSDATLATAITETYTLNASLAPGSVSANISQLKYKVVNNGALTVSATANGTGAVSVTSAAGSGYVTPATPSATVANTLALSLTSAAYNSTTQTVAVTAFLDSNSNGLVESTETQATQTVTFVKYSEITTTTTIAAVTEGDTSVTATVKFNNINNQSLDTSEVGAYFTKGDGSAFTVPSYTLSGTVAVASNVATVTTASAHNLSVGDIVVVSSSAGTLTDGTYVVTAVPTSTTYSFAFTASNGALTTTSAVFSSFPTVLKTRVSYSATAAGFKYTTGTVYSTGTTGIAKSTAVKVQPLFKGSALLIADGASASAVAAVEIGTAQTLAVTTRGLASLTGSGVLSTTAETGATPNVALNKEKQISFLAKDTATTVPAGGNPKAGQAVTVAVSLPAANSTAGDMATAATGVSLTINGVTYSTAAALPGATGVAKLALTTGADGKVVVTYKTTGFENGDDVVFTATAENYTATVTANEQVLTYSQYIDNNEGNTAVTTDGTAVSLNVVVQDQFGGSPADGTFQIAATQVANDQVTPATSGTGSDTFAPVVGGKATLSLKDNGTGVGTVVFGLVRYSVNANGVVSSPVDFANTAVSANPTFSSTFATGAATVGGAGEATRFDLVVKTAADIAAGEVVLNATLAGAALGKNTGLTAYVLGTNAAAASRVNGASDDKAQLAYSTFVTQDGRKIAVPAVTVTGLSGADVSATTNENTAPASGGVLIYGTVNSASTATYGGVAIPSATVTVSGTDMMFVVTQDNATIYGAGSVTFNAGSAGTFTVTAYSHKAGTNLVTVKSGSGTAVLETNFKDAVELAASAVTLKVADGAAQFQAGRALDVTVAVADKFGNPVALDGGSTADDAKLTIAQTGSGYLSVSGDVTVTSTGSYATKLITNAGDLGTSTITATVNFYDSTLTDVVKTTSSEFGVTDADVTVGGRAVYASVEFAKGKTVTVSVDGKRLYSKLFSTDAYTELKFTQKKAGKHVVTVRVSGGIVYSETVTTTK